MDVRGGGFFIAPKFCLAIVRAPVSYKGSLALGSLLSLCAVSLWGAAAAERSVWPGC